MSPETLHILNDYAFAEDVDISWEMYGGMEWKYEFPLGICRKCKAVRY